MPCYLRNLDGEDPIGLSGFSSLREISWTDLQSPGDFDALSSVLENNSARLEQLQLDLVNWSLGDEDDFTNFFAREVNS